LDFFFWGFVKNIAYREKLQTVNELCDRIVSAAECVTNEVLASTCPETEYRLYVCRATNSAHIEIY
jgi:predicted DNA-binding ribbon-helix-helix protein